MDDNSMKSVSAHDREILRQRARLQRHYAESSRNEVILKQWQAQAEGRRDTPPVRLLFSNFRHELATRALDVVQLGALAQGFVEL